MSRMLMFSDEGGDRSAVQLGWLVERLLTPGSKQPPGPVRPVATTVAAVVWTIAGLWLASLVSNIRERLGLPHVAASAVLIAIFMFTGGGLYRILHPAIIGKSNDPSDQRKDG